MKRYIKSTSEVIPEELASRPYVFILNSMNSTYNDEILECAEKYGAIKVKYQQKIPYKDQLYREGYWCFAVDEKATAQLIWDEVKAMRIPTHQDSLNIAKTDWNNNYNIWIDDYANGIDKVEWHESYPVKASSISRPDRIKYYYGEGCDRTPVHFDGFRTVFDSEKEAEDYLQNVIYAEPYYKEHYPNLTIHTKREFNVRHEGRGN